MLGRLKRLVFKNMVMKILSIVLAILLWYLASGQKKIEVGFTIPVELANISDTVAIEGSSLHFVLVRLRGMRSALQELSLPQLRANLDLSSLKPGDNYIPITSRDIQMPPGVELVSISPSYLSIKASARRLVSIKVKLRGKPASGYEVEKVTAIPSNIYVIGPPEKVDRISEIFTLPINIKGATSLINAKAELAAPDPEIRLLELKPTEVNIGIKARIVEKKFKDVVILASEGQTVDLNPQKVQVTLSGPFNLITSLESNDIKAEVDLTNTEEKVFSRKVLIKVPEGINILDVRPDLVQVILTEGEN